MLLKCIAVYENEFIERGIVAKLVCPDETYFLGWENDLYVIITNLLDNSNFWLINKKCEINLNN